MEENQNKNKKVKKLIPIILVIALVIILLLSGLFFIIGRGNSETENLNLIFDPDKPIPVKIDDLYGYISAKNGKVLIDAKFKTASSFYGDYASVSYSESGSTKYGIIDKKGNIKLSTTSSTGIRILSEYGLFIVDNVLYNKKLKALTDDTIQINYQDLGYSSYIKSDKNGNRIEGGVINSNGKKVYSYKFKNSESYFSCSIGDVNEVLGEFYGVANVNNEKYAIINLKNGKVVYDYTDKFISADDDNIFKIYSKDDKSLESTVCISNNKIIYETSDNIDISYYDIDNKILQLYNSSASYSNRYSYYDLKNKSALSEKPEKLSDDTLASLTGYTSYTSNSKHGVMKGEKVILSCEYDDIEFLSPTTFNYLKNKIHKELVLAEKDDVLYLINLKNKKTITSFNTSSVTTYSTSTFIKGKLKDSNEYFVYNLLTGKTMTFDSNCTVSVYSNYITVSKDGTIAYYNTNLKEIYKI